MSEPKRQIPPSPFTPEMLKEAISSSHTNCTEGCIHAETFGKLGDYIPKHVNELGLHALMDADNPLEFIYYAAFHTGYRLHQMMTDPTPKDKVN